MIFVGLLPYYLSDISHVYSLLIVKLDNVIGPFSEIPISSLIAEVDVVKV